MLIQNPIKPVVFFLSDGMYFDRDSIKANCNGCSLRCTVHVEPSLLLAEERARKMVKKDINFWGVT